MDKKVLHLRLMYWLGAIFDGLTLLPMLFPGIGGVLFGMPNFNPGIEYRYAMGLGASLMAGWTVLLFWADRKPVERRDIMLITLFPVLSGLVLANVFAVANGMVTAGAMAPMWIFQAVLFILGSGVYIQSRSLKNDSSNIRKQEAHE
jgi:hypothetical protein